MGQAKSESQTFSLFHGTSALSAIKIDCDGFFVYDTSIHGGKTGIFGQALLTDALFYAKRKPPTSVVEKDEFLSPCVPNKKDRHGKKPSALQQGRVQSRQYVCLAASRQYFSVTGEGAVSAFGCVLTRSPADAVALEKTTFIQRSPYRSSRGPGPGLAPTRP